MGGAEAGQDAVGLRSAAERARSGQVTTSTVSVKRPDTYVVRPDGKVTTL
jgi:hypothetical protein